MKHKLYLSIGLICTGLAAAGYYKFDQNKQTELYNQNRDQILFDAEAAILQEDLPRAEEQLNLKPISVKDSKVSELQKELNLLEKINEIRRSDGYFDHRIGAMHINDKYRELYCSEQNYISSLLKIRPSSEKYLSSLIDISRLCNEEISQSHRFLNQTFEDLAEKTQGEIKEKYLSLSKKHGDLIDVNEQKERRLKQVERLFSAWDGSATSVVTIVKQNMLEPRSFEHIETRYYDMNDYIEVHMQYRGKNAFGGVVRNSVLAKMDINGKILYISN